MRYLLILYLIQIIAMGFDSTCAETRNPAKKPSLKSESAKPSASQTAGSGTKTALNDSETPLPVRQWIGKKFVLLPKQKIVQAFGYGLYLSPELDRSKTRVNPELETKEGRIRCEAFGQGELVAQEIKPSGKEYLVRFRYTAKNLSLYARTHKNAIEGLALAEDMDKARKRWVGTNVYSMRRFINTYDSITGNVSTHKVKICDPLKVVKIRWGTTPLPSRPIWLMVETPQGLPGFIPVCVSWANIMIDKISNGRPWEDDILEQDPKKLYSWDNVYWEAVDNHAIVAGMTKTQVRLSWGMPQSVRRDTLNAACRELWLFDDGQEFRFIGDSLVAE